MKRIVSLVVVAVLVGAGVWGYLYTQSRGNAPKYRTVRVERGPLTSAVSATGNLNAVTTVQVGSQVSGQIKELMATSTPGEEGPGNRADRPGNLPGEGEPAQADVAPAQATVINQRRRSEGWADIKNAKAAWPRGSQHGQGPGRRRRQAGPRPQDPAVPARADRQE
jgi:HlyD family secretion protein